MVCATPRSGVTLSCELLTATGVAGRPEEPFERLYAINLPRQGRAEVASDRNLDELRMPVQWVTRADDYRGFAGPVDAAFPPMAVTVRFEDQLDNIRHGLSGDLGFDESSRFENVRRVAHVARLFADAGAVAVVSPLREAREHARRLHAEADLPITRCSWTRRSRSARDGTRRACTRRRARAGSPRSRACCNAFVLIELDGGTFRMGSEDPDAHPADAEGPVREETVAPFAIGGTTVTVAEFAAFADATGYATDAERAGWSFVFHARLPADHPPTRAMVGAEWWRQVVGASFRDGPPDHPAVHVSLRDALAYCAWAGGRLPTETEWEFAARGGLDGKRYPWGDGEPTPERANLFRGVFPHPDEPAGTLPADALEPNGYGLHHASGNVWEWCQGGAMRGGSYLCHPSYCNRYRVPARTSAAPDSSSDNLGFRMARGGQGVPR